MAAQGRRFVESFIIILYCIQYYIGYICTAKTVSIPVLTTPPQETPIPDHYPTNPPHPTLKPPNYYTEDELVQIQNDYMNLLNAYRKAHGVPEVCICPQHNSLAFAHATDMLKMKRLMLYSGNRGENVAFSEGIPPSGNYTVELYYEQAKNYKWYGQEPPANEIRNVVMFSAMVWRSVKEVGFSWNSDGYSVYYASHFYPMTNILGRFKQNVLPPHNPKTRPPNRPTRDPNNRPTRVPDRHPTRRPDGHPD